MKIEYLFTKSRKKKIGSRLIAWSTGKLHPDIKSCSHVALKMNNLVLESTLSKGVDIVPYNHWIKNHKVIHAMECPLNRRAEQVINTAVNVTYNKKYDWLGIMYFTWRMLGFLILKKPLSHKNRWHNPKRFFCVEIITAITGETYEMTSPVQLAYKWKKAKVKQLNPDKYNKLVY